MEEKAEDVKNTKDAYADLREEIQALVTSVSETINTHEKLKNKNLGLFYQHGRLSYVDLDIFAKAANIEKLIAERKNNKSIDKEEK